MHLSRSVVVKNSSLYSSAMQEILSQSGQMDTCVRGNGDLGEGDDGGEGDSFRCRVQSNVGVSLIVLVF